MIDAFTPSKMRKISIGSGSSTNKLSQQQHQPHQQHQQGHGNHQHHTQNLLRMAAGDDDTGKSKKKRKAKKKTTKKKKATKAKKKKATKTKEVTASIDMSSGEVLVSDAKTSTEQSTKKKKESTSPLPPPSKIFEPSRISIDDEDTPLESDSGIEEVSMDDIPQFHYDKNAVPIPHQPWRRGDTDGCEDPITAPWRIEAEEIIRNAANDVGGIVKDITWYMAALVITIDDDCLNGVVEGPTGPEIRVYDDMEAMWFDPDDPEPEDDYGIYEGEADGRIEVENEDGSISSGIPNDPYVEREFDEVTGTFMPPPQRPSREEAVRNMTPEEHDKWLTEGMKVQLTDRDERISKHKMSMEDFQLKLEELRATTDLSEDEMEIRAKDLRAWYLRSEDLEEYYPEEFEKIGSEEALREKLAMPVLERADGVDTHSVSIIARAIITALEEDDVEDSLEVLSRHEIIMTSPGPDGYVETQREFNESRGKIVNVQTQDPFGSNRVLTGNLIDRNALDVYINVKGRMVTIPLNMVAHVTLSELNEAGDTTEEEEELVGA